MTLRLPPRCGGLPKGKASTVDLRKLENALDQSVRYAYGVAAGSAFVDQNEKFESLVSAGAAGPSVLRAHLHLSSL